MRKLNCSKAVICTNFVKYHSLFKNRKGAGASCEISVSSLNKTGSVKDKTLPFLHEPSRPPTPSRHAYWMINVSVKVRPYPRLPIDTCPVTQTSSLVGRLSIKPLSRPLLAEESGSRPCTHRQGGCWISLLPSGPAHPETPGARAFDWPPAALSNGEPHPFQRRQSCCDKLLIIPRAVTSTDLSRLALPLSRHLLTRRHGPTNRLCIHPSFLLLVLLRCPVWRPVSTRERGTLGQWLPRLKESRGTESWRSRILEKQNPGVGPEHFLKI